MTQCSTLSTHYLRNSLLRTLCPPSKLMMTPNNMPPILSNLGVLKITRVLPISWIMGKWVCTQAPSRWPHKTPQPPRMRLSNTFQFRKTKLKISYLRMTFSPLSSHYPVPMRLYNPRSDRVTYRPVSKGVLSTNWTHSTPFRINSNPEIAKINWTNKTK